MPTVVQEYGGTKTELEPVQVDDAHYRLTVADIKDGTKFNISFNRK
jgi:hypothetical protein